MFRCRAHLKWVCFAVRKSYVDQDIIGDIAKIEDWSESVQISTCQGLDLPGQASPNKQSKSLVAKQEVPISPDKVPLRWDLSAWKKHQVEFSQSWQSVTTVRINPSLACASGSYRVANSDNIWRLFVQGKGNHNSSASISITCVLDLANLSVQKEAASFGHELDQ